MVQVLFEESRIFRQAYFLKIPEYFLLNLWFID